LLSQFAYAESVSENPRDFFNIYLMAPA